jgi:hypothetical protein
MISKNNPPVGANRRSVIAETIPVLNIRSDCRLKFCPLPPDRHQDGPRDIGQAPLPGGPARVCARALPYWTSGHRGAERARNLERRRPTPSHKMSGSRSGATNAPGRDDAKRTQGALRMCRSGRLRPCGDGLFGSDYSQSCLRKQENFNVV